MNAYAAHAGIELLGEAGFYGITCLVGRCCHPQHRLRSRWTLMVMTIIFTIITAPITVHLVG